MDKKICRTCKQLLYVNDFQINNKNFRSVHCRICLNYRKKILKDKRNPAKIKYVSKKDRGIL